MVISKSFFILIMFLFLLFNSNIYSSCLIRENNKDRNYKKSVNIYYINGMRVPSYRARQQFETFIENVSTYKKNTNNESIDKTLTFFQFYNSNGNIEDKESWQKGESPSFGINFLKQLYRAGKIRKSPLSYWGSLLQPELKKIEDRTILVGHSMGSLFSDSILVRHSGDMGLVGGVFFGSQLEKKNYYAQYITNDKKDFIASLSPGTSPECHDFDNYISGNNFINYQNCESKGTSLHRDKIMTNIFTLLNNFNKKDDTLQFENNFYNMSNNLHLRSMKRIYYSLVYLNGVFTIEENESLSDSFGRWFAFLDPGFKIISDNLEEIDSLNDFYDREYAAYEVIDKSPFSIFHSVFSSITGLKNPLQERINRIKIFKSVNFSDTCSLDDYNKIKRNIVSSYKKGRQVLFSFYLFENKIKANFNVGNDTSQIKMCMAMIYSGQINFYKKNSRYAKALDEVETKDEIRIKCPDVRIVYAKIERDFFFMIGESDSQKWSIDSNRNLTQLK